MKANYLCTILALSWGAASAQRPISQAGSGPEFEVASIKPSGPIPRSEDRVIPQRGPEYFNLPHVQLSYLLTLAYGIEGPQVFGPDWLSKDTFDVTAKAPPNVTSEQTMLMWRNLLVERFHLAAHRESRSMPVWQLVVAKGGIKMVDTSVERTDDARATPLDLQKPGRALWFQPDGFHWKDMILSNAIAASGRQAPMDRLVFFLQKSLRRLDPSRPLIDKTGLTAVYDLGIQFADPLLRERSQSDDPDIFTAVEQFLGLRIVDARQSVDVLVVDHVDRVASPN